MEEVIVQVEEEISESEEIFKPEEISQPEEIFKPAQVWTPEEITLSPKEFVMPNIEPPKEYTPPPRKEFVMPNIEPLKEYTPPPRNFERPPGKTFSGFLKTEFYLNGALFNQDEHKDDRKTIIRADWQRAQARLRITNDTGELWQNPTIKFRFSPNWGGDPLESEKSLPPLENGASADFLISFDAYELPDKENLSVCLQIYLEGDESKMDEHYWCVWFDVE